MGRTSSSTNVGTNTQDFPRHSPMDRVGKLPSTQRTESCCCRNGRGCWHRGKPAKWKRVSVALTEWFAVFSLVVYIYETTLARLSGGMEHALISRRSSKRRRNFEKMNASSGVSPT